MRGGPLRAGHAEDDGVAPGAVGELLVVAQQAFASGAEPFDGGVGAGVAGVRLPLDAHAAERVEGVVQQQNHMASFIPSFTDESKSNHQESRPDPFSCSQSRPTSRRKKRWSRPKRHPTAI